MRSEQGSIREKSKGVYEVRVSLGYDRMGKRRTKSKTVRGTRKDARNALNALLSTYGQGAGGDITLQDFIWDVYMPWHRAKYPRKDSTKKLEYVLGKICEEMPVKPIKSLSKAFLAGWVVDAPKWKSDKLRAALNKAVDWEYLERNPMAGLHKETPKPERKRLSVEQLQAVLDAMRGTSIEAPVIIQAACGLRKSEALALNWTDIDFEHGKVEVRRTWHYDRDGGWFEDTKNASSRGWVSIPQTALQRLREIRAASLSLGAIATVCGERMKPNTYSTIWKKLARPVLGDAYIPVENLRHTHGSILFDAGVSVEFISKRLRHSSTRITEHYYIGADSTADETSADVFDDLINSSA